MCDTLVALPAFTARGAALFAKNSDRERNEAQSVEIIPAARHAAGESLSLTYIAIPQVEHTHACLICRPFWMWGAEMGANEHGLVIGNEAVQSIMPAQRKRALLGMDLVRLGLERAATAARAVEVITGLLERHGQGGDCGHLGRFYYHNSFMIADPAEAFVLETVGRWWAVERVIGARAISNALGIGTGAERMSADLAAHIQAEDWLGADGRFDFAARLMDGQRDAAAFSRSRCARAGTLLDARRGALTPRDMMSILRDHGPEAGANWRPADTMGRTLCMHASAGSRRSQTTGSLVSELRPGGALHWVTASAAPCLSLFKPVLLAAGLPDQGPRPTDRFDAHARWWRHERLHRLTLRDYAPLAALAREERDALEAAFAERMDQARWADDGPAALRGAVHACWREADAAEERWLQQVAGAAPRRGAGSHGRSWSSLNRTAGLP
jgi:secernin